MNKLIKFVSVAGLSMALAVSAQAGALSSGSFNFALSALPGITGTGSGPGSSAGGAGSVITLGGTPFGTGLTLVTLAASAAAPLSALKATLIAPTGCTFSAGGGGGGGFAPRWLGSTRVRPLRQLHRSPGLDDGCRNRDDQWRPGSHQRRCSGADERL